MVGAAGVPLPGTALPLVWGASIREGPLSGPTTVSLAFAGVVVGDSLGFFAGRCVRLLAAGRIGRGNLPGRARGILERWGGAAVLLTRFLLAPPAAPANLVAASSGVSYRRFLAYGVPGEAGSTRASAITSPGAGGR